MKRSKIKNKTELASPSIKHNLHQSVLQAPASSNTEKIESRKRKAKCIDVIESPSFKITVANKGDDYYKRSVDTRRTGLFEQVPSQKRLYHRLFYENATDIFDGQKSYKRLQTVGPDDYVNADDAIEWSPSNNNWT